MYFQLSFHFPVAPLFLVLYGGGDQVRKFLWVADCSVPSGIRKVWPIAVEGARQKAPDNPPTRFREAKRWSDVLHNSINSFATPTSLWFSSQKHQLSLVSHFTTLFATADSHSNGTPGRLPQSYGMLVGLDALLKIVWSKRAQLKIIQIKIAQLKIAQLKTALLKSAHSKVSKGKN